MDAWVLGGSWGGLFGACVLWKFGQGIDYGANEQSRDLLVFGALFL